MSIVTYDPNLQFWLLNTKDGGMCEFKFSEGSFGANMLIQIGAIAGYENTFICPFLGRWETTYMAEDASGRYTIGGPDGEMIMMYHEYEMKSSFDSYCQENGGAILLYEGIECEQDGEGKWSYNDYYEEEEGYNNMTITVKQNYEQPAVYGLFLAPDSRNGIDIDKLSMITAYAPDL